MKRFIKIIIIIVIITFRRKALETIKLIFFAIFSVSLIHFGNIIVQSEG